MDSAVQIVEDKVSLENILLDVGVVDLERISGRIK
jgi:hypothetical protein